MTQQPFVSTYELNASGGLEHARRKQQALRHVAYEAQAGRQDRLESGLLSQLEDSQLCQGVIDHAAAGVYFGHNDEGVWIVGFNDGGPVAIDLGTLLGWLQQNQPPLLAQFMPKPPEALEPAPVEGHPISSSGSGPRRTGGDPEPVQPGPVSSAKTASSKAPEANRSA